MEDTMAKILFNSIRLRYKSQKEVKKIFLVVQFVGMYIKFK